MNKVHEWMQGLARDLVTVPANVMYPSAWDAGLPADPCEFTEQLVQFQTALDRANSLNYAHGQPGETL